MNTKANFWNLLTVVCFVGIAFGTVGCSPPPAESEVTATTGDSHDHPESLSEAVETLAGQYAAIKTAFDAGTPNDAHGALHEVGHTLGEMPELAGDLTEEGKASLASTIETLSASFGELDGSLHPTGEEEELDFGPIDAKIAEAMKTLTELATK